MDPPPANGGPVMAEDNVINRKAGSDQSLYQICVNLRRRLAGVPGFQPHLQEMAADDEEDQATDPVTSTWRCFRKGYPLMTIVNASNPEVPLEVDTHSVREAKIGKAATFKFLQSCMTEFQFPAQECFLISDLYTDDTNGFVKVAKVVNRVLDILDQRGLLYKSDAEVVDQPHRNTPTTTRQHIIEELIRTEKDYIGHLEMLQLLKKQLEETGRLTGDSIYSIFLNLNNILDFGRRFLIRIEQHDQLPEDKQNWGQLFTHYQGAFSVYEPFIANNSRCTATVELEWDKISMIADHSRDLQQMVASVATLSGFLLKPFQRMTRYPMMLHDLRKRGGLNEEQQADCDVAIEAIQDVLNQANSAVDKEHREAAVQELYQRVDDWKGIKRDSFGELLLFGNFTVLKGDGGKDTEREYSIYLFERILLCCKDVNPTKQRSNVMSRNRDKPLANVKGKPRLQLKGRIFMANVTDIISSQKPGSYTIQIFWKGDPGVENFIIRFSSEDVMRKWYKAIDDQRAMRSGERARQQGTSNTQFNYLMNEPQIENPYQTEEDAELEDEQPVPQSEFSMSRTASSNSLRARSATGGSGGSGGIARPSRFPMPEQSLPPLSLQTQFSGTAPSPSERVGNSYFSPVEATPLSTRSSAQSSSYFPRQPTPVNAREAENNRYTAPALSRAASRESQSSYYANGRSSRPSLQPAVSAMSAQQIGIAQSRARSASSPDIHNPNGPGRRYPVMPPEVPVPPIPAHMTGMRAPVNRSQNNSPTNTNGVPVRTATQSQQYGYRYPNSTQYGYEQQARSDGRPPMVTVTNGNGVNSLDRVLSPPISEPINEDDYMPGQLKAKVSFEDNYVTLVIASNIHFRSLTDRVEAKLARFTNRPIGKNSVRLRYKDEDGDFVTIDSDEAVQEAFLEWREQHRNLLAAGQMGQVGEIQLFCQVVDAL